MPTLRVRDRDGIEHEIEATPGLKLMEILREQGYGVSAICGGMCSCGTCHVHVHSDWMDRLPRPQSDELEVIAALSHVTAHSRLACQVEFTAAMNHLQIAIAPED